jgi:DNA-binding LytR/AlgR family response regulator
MRIVIVEDETPAANRLERMIKEIRPQVEVVKRLDSVEDAVEYFNTQPALDLAFLDIQLADGLSFDIFSSASIPCPIIFTTAYDHYAVKAFKVNSVDYLLKPVDEEELKHAIEKFEQLHHNGQGQLTDVKAIIQAVRGDQAHYRKRFLVKNAGRLVFLQSEDVAYFFSEEGITFLVTRSNERYLLEATLEELETQLDPECYFRINRKMIICSECIDRIEPYSNNRLLLKLKPDFAEEVVVSRHRTAEFKQWLDH